jgi:hypothetical protein
MADEMDNQGARPRRRCSAALAYLALALAAGLVSRPTWSEAILNSQANDLANQVRHVEEYRLAIREKQLIPLVAPTLNGATRIPLFQYYTGTAHALPGLLAWTGLNAWAALLLAVGLQSFAAGLAVRRLCRVLGCDRFACLVAALAFQLFPFGGVDLYNRGAYVEWAALQWLPLLAYLSFRLAQPASTLVSACRTLLLAAVWAWYIPIHPLQTLYAGGPLAALALVHCGARARTSLRNLLLGYATGTLLASWFWLPVLLDFPRVQNLDHLGFFDACVSWRVVLAPWFQDCTQFPRGWAPQVGLPFFLAACATALYRPAPKRIPWLAAVLFLFLLAVALPLRTTALVQILCKPLQWNYRLLIPGAVLGAICLGWSLTFLTRFGPAPGRLLGAAVLLYVVVAAVPYFSPEHVGVSGWERPTPVAEALAPAYRAPNSSQYTYFGTDFRSLGWVEADRLLLNRDHPLPWEGLPFEFSLTVTATEDLSALRLLVDQEAQPFSVARCGPGSWSLRGLVVPAKGQGRVAQRVRFDLPRPVAALEVADFLIRGVEYRAPWFRLPRSVAREDQRGKRYRVSVPPGRPGLYQLPVNYFTGLRVRVNGIPVEQSSSNAHMLVVPLQEGENGIEIAIRPHPVALALMAGAVLFWLGLLGRLWYLARAPAGACQATLPLNAPGGEGNRPAAA